MKIGLKCFKDEQLNSMVESYNRVGDCDISGEKHTIIYDTEKDEYLTEYIDVLLDMFTVAKYMGIDETSDRVEYLRHFLVKWNVFSLKESDVQNIIKEICKERYSEQKDLFEELVTVQEWFNETEMNSTCILKNYSWDDFCNNIKYNNRFFSNHINLKQLKVLFENMMIKAPKGMLTLFRSRINDESHYYQGYPMEEMGTPPIGESNAGRTNSEGIQCLYLSNNEETTFHEIRARDKDYVSIGKFEQKKELRLVDFTKIDDVGPFSFSESNMTWFSINISIIQKIENEISKPMRRFDSKLDYLPTQYLCDCIKDLGYDGIVFNSTLTPNGVNYAIFDESYFSCKSKYVKEIVGIDYRVEKHNITCRNGVS